MGLTDTILTRAVLLPIDDFALVHRVENEIGITTMEGLIAMLRVRPDLLKGVSQGFPDWLSVIHDVPSGDVAAAGTSTSTNASSYGRNSKKIKNNIHGPTAAPTAVELPIALSVPVTGSLPAGIGLLEARARGNDVNLHPDTGMSLGELGAMGYPIACWRRRDEGVDAHMIPEAETRVVTAHAVGSGEGAVIAEPVVAEVHHKIEMPMWEAPIGTMGFRGMGVGSGRHVHLGSDTTVEHLLTTLAMAQSGGRVGGGMRTGFAPMRRGPVVFAFPQWTARARV